MQIPDKHVKPHTCSDKKSTKSLVSVKMELDYGTGKEELYWWKEREAAFH